jgi:hypothetical protein
MKIPKGNTPEQLFARDQLYQEVLDVCFQSVERRKKTYDELKHYYLYGCAPQYGSTPYNKIYPAIDTLTAFLYSADTTRFSCEFPVSVQKEEWDRASTVSKAVNEEWRSSNGDITFGMGLEWALVYNSAIIKLIVRGTHVAPYVVEPHCIGVYREDVNYLDRQEAIAHRYTITKSQLEHELHAHPNKNQILSQLEAKPAAKGDDMPQALRQIIVTNQIGSGPVTPGNTARGNAAYAMDGRVDYTPSMGAEQILMEELWIWDDDDEDYRVVTRADQNVTIYDRPNFFLPREHPYGHICPDPQQGYFWGRSIVASLIGLQNYRNERMDQVRDLLAKQVNPPTALEAFNGALDEMDFALNKSGGVFAMSDPMSKVHQFKPDIPPDVFTEIRFIDEMFSEAVGLHNLLMGRGESGVRSGRQTSELARLGSARIKKRALLVEDSLDAIVTKYFKALRRYDDSKLHIQRGKDIRYFALDQIPEGATLRVDAHSNSPLFVEDQKSLAAELYEAKAIKRSRLIEMVNPPSKEVILRELEEIEAAEAKAAQAKAAMEASKQAPKQT